MITHTKQQEEKVDSIELAFLNKYVKDDDFFNVCYSINNLESYIKSISIRDIVTCINKSYFDSGSRLTFTDLLLNPELNRNLLAKCNVDLNINIEEFKENVEKYFKKNKLNKMIVKLSDKLFESGKDCSSIPDLLTSSIDELVNIESFALKAKTTLCDAADGLDFISEYIQEYTDMSKLISTGFVGIDNALGGGFVKNSLNLFIAGYHVGKTLLKQNLALNMVEQGNHVLYIPLEMKVEEMYIKLFSRITKTPTKDFSITHWEHTLRPQVEEYLKQINGSIRFAPFTVGELTPLRLEDYCKNVYYKQHGYFPDVVYIDSANLMSTGKASTDSDLFLQGQIIGNGLKGFAQRCDTTVITSIQLNREGYNKVKSNGGQPSSIDVAGSVYWSYVADNILMLYGDPNGPSFNIYTDKNRRTGEKVIVTLRKDTSVQTISDTEIYTTKIETGSSVNTMAVTEAVKALDNLI